MRGAPRPLLYYYSFMNLAKAITMSRGRTGLVGKVSHGISHVGGTGHTASTAKLQVGQSSPAVKHAVDELHRALAGGPVVAGEYSVSEIIAQSVVAHRMWREAFSKPRQERFIPVDGVRFMDGGDKIWLTLQISRATLRARGRGVAETLRQSGLETTFRAVNHADPAIAADFHVLEQIDPISYTGRAADVVVDAVNEVRPFLWQTITASPPYRRYYLYLSPPTERRMPQWLSVYSTFFWLGSLTRYQPVELFEALDGKLGPFFREFLESQPKQLLYMLASDAKQQDVTRAAII
ncbi:YaaC family protein [Brevibacterium sp. SMBL_HHYL_HB1]|uniref:YaaC family protein n=1 Tax=Brevibacterium sp. SMBL_HHYL_HB1 TaxID=2777556 RepID=UPI0024B0DBA1|nr:YaaC family protein [Brevibacterium sp. SMBL_HHYL_HB1]